MFNAITAIREDPSPLWKDGPLEPAHVAAHMEADLPALIGRIMDEVAVDRQVTYYELLHWLGDNLDSLCPFVKTPRRSRRA